TIEQIMDAESWDRFCIFAEAFDLALEARFQTPGEPLGEGVSEQTSIDIRRRMAEIFLSKTTQEWERFLSSEPEIIWDRVQTWSEVLNDQQAVANNYITSVDLPDVGRCKTVGNLVALSETPGSEKGNPPTLGEGNNQILARLGFSPAERRDIEQHASQSRNSLIAELKAMHKTSLSEGKS
ncbi:MAG: CoA transferase, partial [Pseudomonadota bacterium]